MADPERGGRSQYGEFEELFSACYWPVRDYVVRRAPGAAVEDVLAETFVIAWRRRDDIRRGDPVPWLIAVARRVLANELRAARRRDALTDRLRGRLTSSAPVWEPPEEMSPELATAIERLPAVEREVLLLIAWDGLDPTRAAQALGCSPATFRVRLHRARRAVARQLAQTSPSPGQRRLTEEV